jgi:hypothetical protein
MLELIALLCEQLPKWLRKLSPLPTWKNPTHAALVGLLGGGIALAIYFRSGKDGFFCIATALAVSVVINVQSGLVAGALVAAMYGYYRAQTSNERIALRRGGRAASTTHAPQESMMG